MIALTDLQHTVEVTVDVFRQRGGCALFVDRDDMVQEGWRSALELLPRAMRSDVIDAGAFLGHAIRWRLCRLVVRERNRFAIPSAWDTDPAPSAEDLLIARADLDRLLGALNALDREIVRDLFGVDGRARSAGEIAREKRLDVGRVYAARKEFGRRAAKVAARSVA